MKQMCLNREEYIGCNEGLRVQKRKVTVFPMHTHDYYEFELVLSGKGVHTLNSQRYPLQRGSVIFLTPADCHAVEADDELLLWNVSLRSELVPEWVLWNSYAKEEEREILADEEKTKRLESAIQLLRDENADVRCVKALVEYLFRAVIGGAEMDVTDPIRRAAMFAQTHFRDNPTVEQAAKIARLSPVYFGALFKKEYGISFRAFLSSRKINCAKVLILGGMTISAACYESGFNSMSNFSKTFKEHTGLSPREYKRHNGASDRT